ncbi:MAG TPA: large conductance mechanosensitive channel protein MscL [Actinomycetota bacterium]|nr:large conductance mechanosensitive channel protein MscL [Actinomycetota bacterium]
MIREFREFILRGNVVDLAVGIVIGAAFTAVVTAFVENLLMPLVGSIASFDFSNEAAQINGVEFAWGLFVNAVISFLLVSAAVFFLVVKPVNSLMARRKTEPDVESPTKECSECLSSIPAAARRCAFCTSPQ